MKCSYCNEKAIYTTWAYTKEPYEVFVCGEHSPTIYEDARMVNFVYIHWLNQMSVTQSPNIIMSGTIGIKVGNAIVPITSIAPSMDQKQNLF